MIANIGRLLHDERESALIEYALTAALMSLAMLVAVNFITYELTSAINQLMQRLNSNQTSGF